MKARYLIGLLLTLTAFSAHADRAKWEAKMAAQKQACESSQFNTAGIKLPGPPTAGQRPQVSAEQHALFKACREAGIIKFHRHHHHHRAPGSEQGQTQAPAQ